MTFGKIKNTFSRNKYVKMLAFVVAGTQSAAQLAFIPEADADKIMEVEPTLIQVNKAIKDPQGNVAVKATAEGIAAAMATPPAAPASAPATESKFTIESGVPLPLIQRGGVRGETYPFDKLEAPKVVNGQKVYASFFVAATTERPNPAKSLASTVSSATRRYKNNGGRKFTIRAVDVNGVKGARIWRVEDVVAAATPAAA